jgi:hypothetical protein
MLLTCTINTYAESAEEAIIIHEHSLAVLMEEFGLENESNNMVDRPPWTPAQIKKGCSASARFLCDLYCSIQTDWSYEICMDGIWWLLTPGCIERMTNSSVKRVKDLQSQ